MPKTRSTTKSPAKKQPKAAKTKILSKEESVENPLFIINTIVCIASTDNQDEFFLVKVN